MAMQSGDFMNPANVLFTKSTIPETFSDTNIVINHVLARLTFNPKLVNTLPMLEVVQDEQGRWRSENNRYLYAFRVLRIRGLVEKVQVKVINKQLEKCEYASNRDGCHVTMVNNPNIFPHCSCGLNLQKQKIYATSTQSLKVNQIHS